MGNSIGILGAGQLAYFLAKEAKELGFEVGVVGQKPQDPALKIADRATVLGQEHLEKRIPDFLKMADLILFENEWMTDFHLGDREALARPCKDIMIALSNKLRQKRIFRELGFPTSEFYPLNRKEDISDFIVFILDRFPNGFVLKRALGGYDGKGVYISGVKNGVHRSKLQEVRLFINKSLEQGSPVFVEKKVSYERELALVTTRSSSGQLVYYPLVETVQQNGTCRYVYGPIGESVRIRAAHDMAKSIADELGLIGTFALEFFETKEGLLINEIAPRVHNSGHFSLDASVTSQFKNHILAALGKELRPTETRSPFAMINILGPKNYSGRISPPDISSHEANLHWYYKDSSKPGRKLGHINIVKDSKDKVEASIRSITKLLEQWESTYNKKGNSNG